MAKDVSGCPWALAISALIRSSETMDALVDSPTDTGREVDLC